MLPHNKRMMRLRLHEMIYIADSEPVECVMSLVMAAWGFWLLLPYETFTAMTSYRELARIVDERVVGCVVLIIALGQLCSVLNNRVRPRKIMAVFAGLFWGGNFGVAITNASTLLVPIYGVLILASVWLAIRLSWRPRA